MLFCKRKNLKLRSPAPSLVMVSWWDYLMPSGMSARIDGLVSQLLRTDIDPEVITPIFYENYDCLKREANTITTLNLRWLWSLKLIPSVIVKLLGFLIFHAFSFVIISLRFFFGGRKNGMVVQYQDVFSAPSAILAGFVFNVPVIGDDLRLYFKNQKPPVSWFQRIYETAILKNTDFAITSFALDYQLIKVVRENKNSLFVSNGIKMDFPIPIEERNPAIVLFVGQFACKENINALNDILYIAEQLESIHNLQFFVVGGPVETIKKTIKQTGFKATNVTFLGRVSQKRLDHLYRKARIGILPYFSTSAHTSQRIKALEFFSKGLLVLASPQAVDGFKNLVDGKHFVLTKTQDDMVVNLKKIFLTPNHFIHVPQAGRDFIFEHYTWAKVTPSYLKLINSLKFGDLTDITINNEMI